MSFSFSATPFAINQPLELAQLPTAKRKTLNFDSFQQKQAEALRVNPAIKAEQLQDQRAEEITNKNGSDPTHSLLAEPQEVDPTQVLSDLFLRQQLQASAASATEQARISSHLTQISQWANDNPLRSSSELARLGANNPDPFTMGAGDNAKTSPEQLIMNAMADDGEHDQTDPASADLKDLEEKSNEEQISEYLKALREGGNFKDEEEEENNPASITESSLTTTTHGAPNGSIIAGQNHSDAYRAIVERSAVMQQNASSLPVSGVETTDSALTQQLKTDSFIAEIQRMQAMLTDTSESERLSVAA